MKSTLLSSIYLSFIFSISNVAVTTASRPVHRQENRNAEEEFCRKYPHNKKCYDFIPENIEAFCANFATDKRCEEKERLLRQQDSFYCSLMPNSKISSYCKILVKDEAIIVYLEPKNALNNEEERKEIFINKQDIFSFHSQWWLADVGDRQDSVGMFTEIQIGYLLSNSQRENKSNFLTISADGSYSTNLHQVQGFSNENIPKIVEQLEPWLYHNPDMAAIAPLFKPEVDSTNGQVANNVRRLLNTNECPRCNLAGADLAETILVRANLEGANLEKANLEGANLGGAYLIGANLDNANLDRANLKSSVLMFSSLKNSSLLEANLQAANIRFANFNNANLTQSRLNADGLNVTQLQNTSLINANLTEANLSCANLDSTNLKNANLTKANLGKCTPKINIKKGDISNFLLNKAKVITPLSDIADGLAVVNSVISLLGGFSGSRNSTKGISNLENLGMRSIDFIGDTSLNNVNLSGANLSQANLNGANLFNSNLSSAILNSTDVQDTDFSNSNLNEAQINNLELEKAFLCNTIMPNFSVAQDGCDM